MAVSLGVAFPLGVFFVKPPSFSLEHALHFLGWQFPPWDWVPCGYPTLRGRGRVEFLPCRESGPGPYNWAGDIAGSEQAAVGCVRVACERGEPPRCDVAVSVRPSASPVDRQNGVLPIDQSRIATSLLSSCLFSRCRRTEPPAGRAIVDVSKHAEWGPPVSRFYLSGG
uniref:Uncharacterized protein n=1 Tax=Oryza sativa subsp. japonica TaxID=39947 RepID=Q5Z4W8_ORYSJ|nr:hypothetical protein [Oryza sativa Japonica Group]